MPHRCLLGNLPGFVYSHDGYPQPRDLFWSPADWAWTGGLMDALLPTLYFGQPILGYRGRFDPERALRLIEKYQVRNSFLFPTALKLIMKAFPKPRERFDVDLRTIMSAGESVGTTVFAWAQEALGVTINEMFGQTEMNYIVGNSSANWPAKAGLRWAGLIPDIACRRRRPRGRKSRAGKRATSPSIASRRTARPIPCSSSSTSATRTRRAGSTSATGAAPATWRAWMPRATCGTRDAPTTCSRSRGTRGSVRDRELHRQASGGRQRRRHSDSRRDARQRRSRHSSCSLRVSSRRERLEEDIQQHVRKFLAPYEYPKEIEFLDALPMTTTGKVQRKVLRDREAERRTQASK
jgi:acetyl-CoA synthetase